VRDEVPPRCEVCRQEVLTDLPGHYRFHRNDAISFLEMLIGKGVGIAQQDTARERVARCDRLLAELEGGKDSGG
jgi:hypothetical protein